MTQLFTTLGPKSESDLTFILPHEHVFVDLGAIGRPGYGEARTDDVVALMAPEIEKIKAQGVTALVECTPADVGRRVDIVKAVSQATQFPIAVATGLYREPWTPQWARDMREEQLQDWMHGELQHGIGDTGVQAAFIKLSAGDDGITEVEKKILRAASRAARMAGAAIGSHTIRGRVVRDQLDIIEAEGHSAARFVWIHASAEPDFDLNVEMGRRGAWIEYDWIGGSQSDEFFTERIHRMLDEGLGHRLLLSMDRGWYDPSKPAGGTPAPYTYLIEHFLPKLRSSGIDDQTIHMLTHVNPFKAFSR
jgi:phosphotriesterase-related protein